MLLQPFCVFVISHHPAPQERDDLWCRLSCLFSVFLDDLCDNIIQRRYAKIAVLAGAERYAVCLNLVVTDDEEIGDLFDRIKDVFEL